MHKNPFFSAAQHIPGICKVSQYTKCGTDFNPIAYRVNNSTLYVLWTTKSISVYSVLQICLFVVEKAYTYCQKPMRWHRVMLIRSILIQLQSFFVELYANEVQCNFAIRHAIFPPLWPQVWQQCFARYSFSWIHFPAFCFSCAYILQLDIFLQSDNTLKLDNYLKHYVTCNTLRNCTTFTKLQRRFT